MGGGLGVFGRGFWGSEGRKNKATGLKEERAEFMNGCADGRAWITCNEHDFLTPPFFS
jgi:hypothetical protein